jgi:hypothetical protein
MKDAKCYGVWGIPYFRTEEGDTYSVASRPNGLPTVFYWGNVLTGERYKRPKILSEEEAKEINFIF